MKEIGGRLNRPVASATSPAPVAYRQRCALTGSRRVARVRRLWRWAIAFGALQMSAGIEAQIYTCKAPDGTRIFSDERCGPDAKVVPNISTTKKPPPKTSSAPQPKVESKTSAELESLLEACNAGDMTACNTWTRAGGPNSLRTKEQQAEKACATGSLADCEYRYCSGAVNDACRTHVLQAAKVAGDNWYLRDTGKPQPDGTTRYNVRCVPPGIRAIRDVVVICAANAGPTKCAVMGSSVGQPRLDQAASATCGS